jgi:murein DD-endopeptidase MepM/ murein hydrolase activator NlpD
VAAAPAAWTDSYTIKSGDSLYSVARRRGVTVAELQRVNAITDVRKVMPGAVIKVPPESTESRQAAAAPAPSSPSVTPTVSSQPTTSAAPSVTVGLDPQTAAGPRPTVINAPRVAAVDTKGTATDVPPAVVAPKQEPEQPKSTASGDLKLRWPVKGRVISKFGPQSDGTQNDGVNVAVPLGAEVLAAESGVVAYAGSEVRGYGNLVLVRHDNGWVTAYAHNDELMVQRGDRVRRGQSLAKAGRTGNVDQPQVHFELRQGPKPVDPTPYMERM